MIALFVLREDDEVVRTIQMLPATVGAMGFSIWVIRRVRAPEPVGRLLVLSVLVDAGVCGIVISSNVLRPFESYRGLLLLPETATFLALIVSAGFRIHPRLALVGTAANGGVLAALVALDEALNGDRIIYGFDILFLYGVLVAAVSFLALATARRTLELVRQTAEQSTRLGRAQREFGVMLEEHHDTSSLLSALRFDVERLRARPNDAEALDHLAGDLAAVEESVSQIRDRAYTEVLAICPAGGLDVASSITAFDTQLERIVAPLSVTWRLPGEATRIRVAGGVAALRRILLNLLTNARDGDGTSGATRAEVEVVREGELTGIRVIDDGPGFRDGALGSTKRSGTGTGLALVASLTEASGGRFDVADTPAGAIVTAYFPNESHDV